MPPAVRLASISTFVLALAPFAAADVAANLARLASPNSAERAAATRQLAAELRAEDRPVLETALKSGTPETRARIVEALGSADGLVGLASALAAATDKIVSGAGREALVESILRWSPDADEAGLDAPALRERLRTEHTEFTSLDALLASAPLEDVLDLVQRYAPKACALAIDPSVDPDALGFVAQAIEGPFDVVLLRLCEQRGLDVRGFGWAEDAAAGSPAWIVIAPRAREDDLGVRSTEAGADATARIVEWCIAVERAADPRARSRAARALAGCGWPAAVAWLAERFVAGEDAAALDGIALAARRGRVAPQLFDPVVQARVRAALDRELAREPGGDVRAIRCASTLGATGLRGIGGADLLASTLNELASLPPRALYARLVELEAREPKDERARTALDAVLRRTDVPLGTRFLALEIRARAGTPIDELPRAEELVEWAASHERLPELAARLRGARAFPPETWRDPVRLPGAWTGTMRMFVVRGWLDRREVELAALHVVSALAQCKLGEEAALAQALEDATEDVERAQASQMFARVLASDRLDPADALRWVARAGGASSVELAERVLQIVAQPAVTRADMSTLAALAAGPRGEFARQRLLESVRASASDDDVVAALDEAVVRARSARDEVLERAFVKSVREQAQGTRQSLRARLRVDVWPARPAGERVRLADFERSFRRAGS